MGGNRVREARLAAALLALGIQRKNSISDDDFDRVLVYASDSLGYLGVALPLEKLRTIDKVSPDEGVQVVTDTKSAIISGIAAANDSKVTALFELTFNLYLISTTPEIAPGIAPILTQLEKDAGLENGLLARTLDCLENDPGEALGEFEAGVDAAFGEGEHTGWLHAVNFKVGFGVVDIDVKKLYEQVSRWIKDSRS